MSDITMCNGDGCSDKETCLRYKSKPSLSGQSYCNFEPLNGGRCEYYWGVCKYIKKEGASCSLNNNCKYPNCTENQQNILKQLNDIVDGKG